MEPYSYGNNQETQEFEEEKSSPKPEARVKSRASTHYIVLVVNRSPNFERIAPG